MFLNFLALTGKYLSPETYFSLSWILIVFIIFSATILLSVWLLPLPLYIQELTDGKLNKLLSLFLSPIWVFGGIFLPLFVLSMSSDVLYNLTLSFAENFTVLIFGMCFITYKILTAKGISIKQSSIFNK